MLRFAAQLLLADHRQHRPEAPVVGNRALVDLWDLIEGSVGLFGALVADRQPAAGIIHHSNPLAGYPAIASSLGIGGADRPTLPPRRPSEIYNPLFSLKCRVTLVPAASAYVSNPDVSLVLAI
jgi:hypothetical protein